LEDQYKNLEKIRNSKTIKLKPNKYLKPEVQLRYYQTIGVANMYMMKRTVLGDETGTGKTLQAIGTYTSLLLDKPEQKMIVVCPSSAMYQWASEFNKFCQGITTQVVESENIKVNGKTLKSFDSREYQFNLFLNENKNVVIFNYNTMKTDFHIISEMLSTGKYMVVFDEATAFKNHKSQTYLYAKKISELTDRVYALSATIIKNNLLEAWSIYKVLLPNLFGSIEHFTKTYCLVEIKQLWKGRGRRGRKIKKIVGYKNLDHFKKTIYPFFLGRKKADIASDLPEIISQEVITKMDEKQTELYEDVVKGFLDFNKFSLHNFQLFLDGEDGESLEDINKTKYIDKLTALIYCQQISNSPHTLGFNTLSSKEEELIRRLSNELAGEKVVIYSRFKKMVDRLEDLIKTKIKVECTKITGDIKSRQREENKNRFNESQDCNIILINSAAKEAMNLQSSGYLIFFDMPFSYGDFLQIIGRIHRIGSPHEKIMLLYMINKDTVDEKVMKILTSKKDLFDKVLGDSAKGALRPDEERGSIVNTIFEQVLEEAENLNKNLGLNLGKGLGLK